MAHLVLLLLMVSQATAGPLTGPARDSQVQRIQLESWNWAYAERSWGHLGTVTDFELIGEHDYQSQHSVLCIANTTFGFFGSTTWVKGGCRGDFDVTIDTTDTLEEKSNQIIDQLTTGDLERQALESETQSQALKIEDLISLVAGLMDAQEPVCVPACDGGKVCLSTGRGGGGYCADDLDTEGCGSEVDVAIVGAGPGGAYAAYNLRNKGLTVALYEYSDIVGGRTQNYILPNAPDVNLPLGAMRYIADTMPRLEGLIEEFGLETSLFKLGFGSPARYSLRGQNIPDSQLSSGEVPYNLTAEEKANQGRLYYYYIEKLTGATQETYTRDELDNLRLTDGRLLSELSLQGFLTMAASSEAKAMIKDSSKFQMGLNEPTTNILMTLHENFGGEFWGGDVMQITDVGGMQAVPLKMVEAFLQTSVEKHSRTFNMQLKAIRLRSDRSSKLFFQPTQTVDGLTTATSASMQTVCAKQTILALPQAALMQVDWPALKSEWVADKFDGAFPAPASKIFLTFDQAWWLNGSFTNYASPVTVGGGPTAHQIYDWEQSSTTGEYILQIYSDGPNVGIQKGLQYEGATMPGSAPGAHRVSIPLKDALLDDFARVFGVDRAAMPEPTSGVAKLWTGYPFGGGWAIQRAGYGLQDLVDDRRRPSILEKVYIVGSDYSYGGMIGTVEGAYETTQSVLNEFF